ncbi:hypothetical protein PanWU01x14_007800 [Parasponia andersonii]|uniref:Uncharacterized protein n=1 Tax=Parasponia andersonii TaxID=3476 RepID=A0A2P5E4B2_PARAD|nr:hypothetical protein PanWU01x14_007800 [Parasponia andersonii]
MGDFRIWDIFSLILARSPSVDPLSLFSRSLSLRSAYRRTQMSALPSQDDSRSSETPNRCVANGGSEALSCLSIRRSVKELIFQK